MIKSTLVARLKPEYKKHKMNFKTLLLGIVCGEVYYLLMSMNK
jgi:hypothetical protein